MHISHSYAKSHHEASIFIMIAAQLKHVGHSSIEDCFELSFSSMSDRPKPVFAYPSLRVSNGTAAEFLIFHDGPN